MRRHVYTSSKTELLTVSHKIWYVYQRNGDFVHLYRSLGLLYRVFEDGTAVYSCKINSNLRDPIIGSKEHNLIAYGSTFYRMDQSIAARREVIVTGMPLTILNGPERTIWLESEAKLLYISSTGYISIYTIAADTTVSGPVSVGNVDVSEVSGWRQLTPYKSGHIIAYNKVNGRVAVLNIAALLATTALLSKTIDTAIGDSFDYVWYSPWNKTYNGINLVLGTVAVYADVVQPDALSTPELLDATPPLHQVQGTRVRTRVISSVPGHPVQTFEPVPNWPVFHFLIGPGSIEHGDNVSFQTSDNDGYVDCYYYGPLTTAGFPDSALITIGIVD